MKTIGDVIKLSSSFLEEKGVVRPRRIAEELLSYVLGLKKMDLYLQYDKPVIETELDAIREGLKRCGKGEPIEYVMGEVDFYGCKIRVDCRALIPRPETEILVDLIAKRIERGVFWDLCTGSGCIGIALKKARPDLDVTLADLSEEALQLAAGNAQLNGVEVDLVQGDLLAPFQGRKADWIVCNPPYVSEGEYQGLDPSVKDFEPRLALVGGERGTEFYERLKRELPPFLNPRGQIFFEIGAGQGEAIKQIFGKGGEVLADWAGHPRFFFLESKVFLEYSIS
jgi:release factor glutamine methyltransferase